jgi:hypothetical protein
MGRWWSAQSCTQVSLRQPLLDEFETFDVARAKTVLTTILPPNARLVLDPTLRGSALSVHVDGAGVTKARFKTHQPLHLHHARHAADPDRWAGAHRAWWQSKKRENACKLSDCVFDSLAALHPSQVKVST